MSKALSILISWVGQDDSSDSFLFWFLVILLILSNLNSHNLSVRPQCGWGGSWVRHVGLPTLWGQRTSGPENSESGKHPQEAGLGSTQPVTSIPLDLKNGRWVTRGLGAVHQTAEGKGEARWRTADGDLGSSLSLKRLQSVFSPKVRCREFASRLAGSSERSWQGREFRTQSLTFSSLLVSISFL